MAVIISSDNVEEHNIDRYSFKSLSISNTQKSKEQIDISEKKEITDTNSSILESEIDASELSSSSKDSLIESLIKKTEEMSANFLKLQAKIEARDEEYKRELQEAKERAFRDGVEQGIKEATSNNQAQFEQAISQFTLSISKLDANANEFKDALEEIKSELVTAALDIAKEVVFIELSSNSSKIALNLANELIDELSSASKITLRVSPDDYQVIKQKLESLERVEIVADSAVSNGGVIAISDAGNIDAQISKRFERVKKTVLSE